MKYLNIVETRYYQIPVPDEFPDEGTEGFHEAAVAAWASVLLSGDNEERYLVDTRNEKYSLE